MQVLNTYVKTDIFTGRLLITFLAALVLIVIYLLKDDLTRFLEHHTIGANFYKYMKHVWKVLMVFFAIFFFIQFLNTPANARVFVEATINEKYPIGPLYERYEIVEKRGDIWVLEQRSSWQEDVDKSSTEED